VTKKNNSSYHQGRTQGDDGVSEHPLRSQQHPVTLLSDHVKISDTLWANLCKTSTSEYTENDCHQWLSVSFRVHQIRFWLELCWGSLRLSPWLPSWF